MLLINKQIAIIGGGPGGLTLARLLQIKGAKVNVYERDASRTIRVQGGTLDLHKDSGLAALEKAGLMDAFKTNYRPNADKLRVVDEHAKIFLDEHNEQSASDFGDEWFRPEIDRGPLRDMLLDSLLPGTVVWDSHVVSMEKIGGAWKLLFQNGNIVVTDIVIGADGANSKIRPFVTSIKPFYSGVMVLERNVDNAEHQVPQIAKILNGGKIMALGNSKTLTMSAKGDGSIDFYIGWKTDADWSANSGIDFKNSSRVLNWFKSEYAQWDDIWFKLFEAGNSPFVPRPQYCMPLNQYWEPQANITLIGDAAHVMPPYAGEGVNMAMLDALQLSESLTSENFTNSTTAIAAYEQQMFTRFAEVGQDTLNNTELMHSPGGLQKLLKMFNQN